ncbi:MAG: alpha/beta hydrolase, partial [Acidimicrobiales bacterium]
MTPDTIIIDVTGRIPLAGTHHIAIQAFAPAAPEVPVPLLFCLPGGTYSKAYWHLEVPGRSSYSFAEHLAAQGMLVVTVDHIGTGESSRHPKAVELTPDVVACANSVALSEVLARARAGHLFSDTRPLEIG